MENIRPPIYLIAAMCDANRGIGVKNDLPWHLPNEYKHFVRLTKTTKDPEKRNAVVMGRACWESIPSKFRPLKGRLNVVLSRTWTEANLGYPPDTLLCHSYDEAIKQLSQPEQRVETMYGWQRIWNVGGEEVYKAGLKTADGIYLTHIFKEFACDRFFPALGEKEWEEKARTEIPQEMQEENGISYQFRYYQRRPALT